MAGTGTALDMIPIAGSALGAIYNIATSGKRAKEAQALNDYERKMQIEGSKELTDYQSKANLQLWKDTGKEAQMQQIKEAGLSPGLIYGGSGAGGSTPTVSTAMPTRGTIPDANAARSNDIQSMMGLAQLGLMKAQTENIQADTNKKENEVPNIKADTTLKGIQGQSLTQGIKNLKTVERLNTIEGDIKDIEAAVADSTKQDAINYIKHEAVRMGGMAKSALAQGNVDEKTQNEKIELLGKQIANVAADTILKKVQAETGRAIATQEEFEAELTKAGIGKGTPWYGKLVTAWLQRIDKSGPTVTP